VRVINDFTVGPIVLYCIVLAGSVTELSISSSSHRRLEHLVTRHHDVITRDHDVTRSSGDMATVRGAAGQIFTVALLHATLSQSISVTVM